MAGYKALVESRMLDGADELFDIERKVVDRQLRRGWYVGSASFGEDLAARIEKVSDNLRGEQRRTHGEREAERLLVAALRALGLVESELLEMKGTRVEKQSVAWLLKKHATVTGVWIAARLRMGHRVNASRDVSAFEKCSDKAVRQLKAEMIQCTG